MKFWRNKKRENEKRFSEIYEVYKDEMYQTAYKVLRNGADAQDAVQDALIRIAERLDKLPQNEKKLRAYVNVMVRNTAIDIYRNNRRHLRLCSSISEEISTFGQRCGADPYHYISAMEDADYLVRCLKRINEDYCEIITLYYYYEYTMKEIANLYELTEKAAATKLFRARKALEKEVERQGYGLLKRNIADEKRA